MSDAGALTFQEFMMGASLPLATFQQTVREFLRGRDDAVVFGAQAANAYVDEPPEKFCHKMRSNARRVRARGVY